MRAPLGDERTMTGSTTTFEPGTPVEVQSSFDRRWSRGFTVETADDHGYRLRRISDGSVLPAAFSPDVVRPQTDGRL